MHLKKLCLAAICVFSIETAEAQELPFRTGTEPSGAECPAWTVPPPAGERMVDAARELSTEANRALVVGDLERARELFEQASELDARSSDLHYSLGRVHEQLEEPRAALAAYCRVLALAREIPESEGQGAAEDADLRREALAETLSEEVPYEARVVFQRGARSAEAGLLTDAARQFRAAGERAPRWPDAFYNEGVALARVGRYDDAAGRLAHYLELRPDADDAVEVARRIGQLERAARASGSSSRAALALGLVVPGFGQMYSGRSLTGLAVLGAAAGAVAAGFLVREADVRCLTTPQPGASCPDEHVVSRTVRKPYLTPALLAAGAVTAVAALEAWLRTDGGASGRPPALVAADADAGALSLGLPGLSIGADHSLDVVVVGLTFR